MRWSKRARRRLIAVVVALGVVVCGISAWRIARKVQLRRLIAESYVEGMTAYRDGDYATALTSLRYYVRRNRGDLEALLAFAEARSRIPEVNERHLTDAISLYRAALKLDPENKKALTQLLVLYPQTGRRPERLEIADRHLEFFERVIAECS